jgi:hypothetical protein
MTLKLLIDGIVQQTTVLIAELSTAAGVRAPLSHVADQVFVELAHEIERQGVRRRVAADMFGLALRSYQKKLQRLTESVSVRERTLWEAMVEFIEEHTPTRASIMERFRRDGERAAAAVLKDLVRNGLVYKTGSGSSAVYGITTDAVRSRVQQEDDVESIANILWLTIFRGEVTDAASIERHLGVTRECAERALNELLAKGRVRLDGTGRLRSANVAIPLGLEHGWEASVLDHYRAVARTIALKVQRGFDGEGASHRVGGSTFTFTVYEGHPQEVEVNALLGRVRAMAQTLWDEVARTNDEQTPDPTRSRRVTFYAGQSEESTDE